MGRKAVGAGFGAELDARLGGGRVAAPHVVVYVPRPTFDRSSVRVDYSRAPEGWSVFVQAGQYVALRVSDGQTLASSMLLAGQVVGVNACYRLAPGEAPEEVECPPGLQPTPTKVEAVAPNPPPAAPVLMPVIE